MSDKSRRVFLNTKVTIFYLYQPSIIRKKGSNNIQLKLTCFDYLDNSILIIMILKHLTTRFLVLECLCVGL